MKLLVAMAHYPFPPRTGSTIVAYHSIKRLSRVHEIHMLCLYRPAETGDLPDLVSKLDFIGRSRVSRPWQWLRYALYVPGGYPIPIVKHKSSRMRERILELDASEKFDGILMFEMSAIQYCPALHYGKLIAHIEDPMSIKLSRMRSLPTCSLLHKSIFGISAALFARYEKRTLPRLARVLLLSQADIEDMRSERNLNNLAWVPYAIDQSMSVMSLRRGERTAGTIIFSGNMDHLPNVDGALFFLRSVFPLVLEKYPSATLRIVGANPSRQIRNAATPFRERVEITGKVADIAEHLRRAIVSVCPVRLKIGTQTKVLEAMCCGTPVVTTSAGNSGVEGISGIHLWVEDDPHLFALRVVALLEGEQWAKLSEGGRTLLDERFSWKHSVKMLEAQLSFLSTDN